MSDKLWTVHFTRICIANLLLYVSLYMLLPVIPNMMANRLNAPIQQTGALFLLFTLGMILAGPFYAYLVGEYKRKNICVLSFLGMIAATLGFEYVEDMPQLWLLALAQGACFGIATTASVTLAIDTTSSARRSSGNIVFAWISRLGMMIGLAIGVYLASKYHDLTLLHISASIGLVGIFFVSIVHVHFRAPMGASLCSFDRFFLPRGWVPAINLVLAAFVPGILLPVLSRSFDTIPVSFMQNEYSFPFFAVVVFGFIIAAFVERLYISHKLHSNTQIIGGLMCVILSIVLLLMLGNNIGAAFLLGTGIGLFTPEFLMMFIKLSQHCQRGTSNTTHLLSWELGVSAGIAVACYMDAQYSPESVLLVGLSAGVMSLLFFTWFTMPYFIRKRLR